MPLDSPIVVTGAAGRIGGVGRTVVELLRQRNLPVRALVRREDERATALRATGAEVLSATSHGPRELRALWQVAGGCISA
jgi:NAD(P)H dehydrogenase (quinone)